MECHSIKKRDLYFNELQLISVKTKKLSKAYAPSFIVNNVHLLYH